jgi:hypothetical protein
MPRLPNGDWLGEDLTEAKQQVLALWPQLCDWTQKAVTKWKNRLPNSHTTTVNGLPVTVDLTQPLGVMAKVAAAVHALEVATPNIQNLPDGSAAMAARLWDLCARAETLTDEECAEFLTDLQLLTSRQI